jgi:hypothetical protein
MIKQLVFFAAICITSCGAGTAHKKKATTDVAFIQSLNLKADDKLYKFSWNINDPVDDLLTASYAGSFFSFSVTSKRENISFSVTSKSEALVKGFTAKVFTCLKPSDCIEGEDARGQNAILGKYPDGGVPILSESRSAYKAANLGLEPFNVTLTDVTDEQMPDARKTKRVKGIFSGVLAYVESDKENNWRVVSTTKVEGDFDLYCVIY